MNFVDGLDPEDDGTHLGRPDLRDRFLGVVSAPVA